ncbi:MAG TPA: alpha-hydroxy acid oxidase [Vicinamibacteria bacterium]|nr:alpha-hydroxy acid oxidase [Vicinamibacteria bacterium]
MSVSRRRILSAGGGLAGGLALAGAFPGLPRARAARQGQGDAPCAADLAELLNLPDFEDRARGCLPHMAYEFVASGAADEITLRWNREAYDRIRLRPRVLRDVARVDTRVTLLGRELPFPILLAPTAYHRVLHPEGEIATARGAGAAQATWVVSTSTTTAVEDIARAATGPLWFQLYVQSDREFTRDVVRRAEDAGCQALCLTVDQPVLGARNRQTRAKFQLPAELATPHMYDIGPGRQSIMDPRRVGVTWKDVDWLRSILRVPLLLKGILDAEDAERAVQSGVQGLLVSNHGARILDTAPATIDALPEVAERVAGRVPVLVDGGIRRGTDVLKAIALGATAVLIGRPYCYGLSVGGSAGVRRVVDILRHELEMAMMLTGRPSLASIDRSVLWEPHSPAAP